VRSTTTTSAAGAGACASTATAGVVIIVPVSAIAPKPVEALDDSAWLALLVQDLGGNVDLADVVDQRRPLHLGALVGVQVQLLAQCEARRRPIREHERQLHQRGKWKQSSGCLVDEDQDDHARDYG
jgi:hypothetical protein